MRGCTLSKIEAMGQSVEFLPFLRKQELEIYRLDVTTRSCAHPYQTTGCHSPEYQLYRFPLPECKETVIWMF